MTTETAHSTKFIFPHIAGLYSKLEPLSLTIMRAVAGIALMVHGWPKINDPFKAVGMVESIGFYPGVLWSPLLSLTEFFGGLLLLIGLLTRPAAFATTIILLVTVFFHWIQLEQGYKGAELSILWSSILFYFVAKGGGKYSVDAVVGKQF